MPYEENNASDESICVGCGCPESKFPTEQGRGYVGKKGDVFCCQECAEGKICSCNPERAREAG